MYLTVKNHPKNHRVYVVAAHGAAVAAVTFHAPSLRGMVGGLVEVRRLHLELVGAFAFACKVLSGYSTFLLRSYILALNAAIAYKESMA